MSKRLVRGLVVLLAATVVGVAFLWPAVMALGLVWLKPNPFVYELGQQVVAAVAAGTLQPDINGEVLLPSRYRSISVTGSAFVTRGKKGLVLVFLPTCYGHTGTDGYLHCSRPLTLEDTEGEDPASGHSHIAVYYSLIHYDLSRNLKRNNLPPKLAGLSTQQLNHYLSRHLPPHRPTIQKLNDHWYRTSEPE
jgi:hypothetical protein